MKVLQGWAKVECAGTSREQVSYNCNAIMPDGTVEIPASYPKKITHQIEDGILTLFENDKLRVIVELSAPAPPPYDYNKNNMFNDQFNFASDPRSAYYQGE